uniref:hypothetical protein n=1 Tax=uncultured Dysgonomonas sp. TaxID=206096 RepID=UPI0026342C8D|nr:hypothetical protein [uncultured Dysgonomonas sp.]
MEKIHPVFIAELNKKFANRFTIESEGNNTFICFPAKSQEFGTIEIYEECPGAYIVYVGKFTHCHFDCYEGSEEAQVKEAAEEITDFLENIFTDNVISYGSHEGGGGCYVKEYEGDDYVNDDYTHYFVWSGIYTKTSGA